MGSDGPQRVGEVGRSPRLVQTLLAHKGIHGSIEAVLEQGRHRAVGVVAEGELLGIAQLGEHPLPRRRGRQDEEAADPPTVQGGCALLVG